VPEDEPLTQEEVELKAAIEAVLESSSRKKLLIAGPGTGKTTLFKRMLELAQGEPHEYIVLTFINNLKNDLERDIGEFAQVHTLHSYCLGLLHRHPALRGSLSDKFRCCPGLASLIADDYEAIEEATAPHFVRNMRALADIGESKFYLDRGEYYDAVDFDDTVFRTYMALSSGQIEVDVFKLVLIDEYQDFNALEAAVIDALAEANPVVIAGDDDQALYSQLRDASWEHIRLLSNASDYEVHKLPFCMRCPKVVVDAVNDVIARAKNSDRLEGRIDKPYKHFPPVKGLDSANYPFIEDVETTVQRQTANYMGRYIAQAIDQIPQNEINASLDGGYPTALVIVAQPYRDQIVHYLEDAGYIVDTKRDTQARLLRETGLTILKGDPSSNLGWRIILGADKPLFLSRALAATRDNQTPLVSAMLADYRERVLAEVKAYHLPDGAEVETASTEEETRPLIKVTSFEGAKGLSAQHVYIAGLHDGELPRDPSSIKDLEICKFIVGLTRTRKMCTLIHTRNFAGNWKNLSSFINWIDDRRFVRLTVNSAYWRQGSDDDAAK